MFDQGYIDDKRKPHGSLASIVLSECDMGMNQLYLRDFWRLETYPHAYSKIFAVSRQESNSESTVVLLPKIFETWTISTFVIISMLVTMYLKYLLKIDIASASFKTLKMLLGIFWRKNILLHQKRHIQFLIYYAFYIVGISVGIIPRGTMGRIHFVFLFLFMFNMNIQIQSMLTSSLATPENKFYIDDKEDLESVIYEYTISGPPYIKEFLDSETLAPHFINSSFEDCLSKIHRGLKIVCLADDILVNYYTKSHKNIHISKEGIENVQVAFVIRENWPLRGRINQLIQRLREAGVIANMIVKEHLQEIKSHQAMHAQAHQHYNSTNFDIKTLTLESLKFNFQILAFGYIISLLAFMIEKTISKLYYKKRIDNLKIFQPN